MLIRSKPEGCLRKNDTPVFSVMKWNRHMFLIKTALEYRELEDLSMFTVYGEQNKSLEKLKKLYQYGKDYIEKRGYSL